jgi:invasion protein IalB
MLGAVDLMRLRLAFLAFVTMPAAAEAAEPAPVATFKSWSVFVRDIEGERICFAAAEAQNKSPTSVNHGDIFFMVATWKSGAATNQPSFMAGYNLKDAPVPAVRVGAEKWSMYADQNEAFIEASKDEQGLIAAMRKGSAMNVTATSSRGTATSYVFSLQGVSAALDRVREACK